MKQSTIIVSGLTLSWIAGIVLLMLVFLEIGAVAQWNLFWVLAPFWMPIVVIQVVVIIKTIILNVRDNSKKTN